MNTEKPQPLKNEDGLINDPEIAKKMAKEEDVLRSNPEKILNSHKKETIQESIDSQTDDLGRMEQICENDKYNQYTENIAKKLTNTLSTEELKIFKKNPEDITRHFPEIEK